MFLDQCLKTDFDSDLNKCTFFMKMITASGTFMLYCTEYWRSAFSVSHSEADYFLLLRDTCIQRGYNCVIKDCFILNKNYQKGVMEHPSIHPCIHSFIHPSSQPAMQPASHSFIHLLFDRHSLVSIRPFFPRIQRVELPLVSALGR